MSDVYSGSADDVVSSEDIASSEEGLSDVSSDSISVSGATALSFDIRSNDSVIAMPVSG